MTRLVIKAKAGAVGARNRTRRFSKHSILAKQARTLTGKKLVQNQEELRTVPQGGLTACFFQEYLDQENMQNPSKVFSDFYRQAYALVQSQALFLHSFPKLVALFVDAMQDGGEDDGTLQLAIPSLLRLLGVLGRDATAALIFDHYPVLLQACLAHVDASNVELTTLVFETVGKLLEACHECMLEQDAKLERLHGEFYADYLGHSSELVRNLTSEVASYLIRKQRSMDQKLHLWALLRYDAEESRTGESTAQVFLHVVRGVNGAFHSQMPRILASLIRALGRKAEAEPVRVRSFMRWMQALKKYAARPSDVIQVLLQEFAPREDFSLRLCQAWLPACDARELAQFAQKLDSAASLEQPSLALTDFALALWNASDDAEDCRVCERVLFGAELQPQLVLASLLALDFENKFVPHVLPRVPKTWAYAPVWIAISKQSSSCAPHTTAHAMFSPDTGKVLLSSEFELPTSFSRELLDFLRWMEPPARATTSLGKLLLSAKEVEEDDPESFGVWALASMMHAQGKSLARIQAKLEMDERFCTREAMEALALANNKEATSGFSKQLLLNISRQLAHPNHETRLAAFQLALQCFPQCEPLQVLQKIHVLETTYESERPRELLGDAFKQALLRLPSPLPRREEVSALCFGVLGMLFIRFRPAWTLAGDLLECLAANQTAEACWPSIIAFFLEIARFSARFDDAAASGESSFTFFLKAVAAGPHLLRVFQRESRAWIPHFFSFLRDEFYGSLGEENLMEPLSREELALAAEDAPSKSAIPPVAAKRKLNSYLEVMSLFDQKKSLYQVDALKLVWKRLLFASSVAPLALKCLQRFCAASLEQSRGMLDSLVKSKEYRSALVDVSTAFRKEQQQNELLIEVLSRLLFAKLVESGAGGGARQRHSVSVSERRRQILHCFASLDSAKVFFTLLQRPFQVIKLDEVEVLTPFARGTLEGFLLLLEQVLPILGRRVLEFLPELTHNVCAIVRVAQDKSCSVLRKESLLRLDEMFQLFAREFDFTPAFGTVNAAVTRMLQVATEDDATSALFRLMATCFREPSIRFRCLDEDLFQRAFLDKIATTNNAGVLEAVFQVVDEMITEESFAKHLVERFLAAIAKRRDVHQELDEAELGIVERVANFASGTVDDKLVVQLLHLLSDHLVHAGSNATKKSSAALALQLKTMTSLSRLLLCGTGDVELKTKVRGILAQLFGPWGGRNMVVASADREALAELFALYHAPTAQALQALNQMIKGKVQIDYDVPARVEAYQTLLNTGSFDDVSASVLVNQALFDLMHCEDFSIRLTAQSLCQHVVDAVAAATHDSFGPLLQACMGAGTAYALDKVETCAVRATLLAVVRKLVLTPQSGLYQDLRFLAADDNDPDNDFFINASHLQTARRSKAMHRIATSAQKQLERVSEPSLIKVILPIAMHSVFDAESQKNEQDAGIVLLAACANLFTDENMVCTLLTQVFKRIAKANAESRIQRRLYLKTACVLYDEHAGRFPLVEAKFTSKLFKHLVSERTTYFDEELNESVAMSLVQRCRAAGKETELDSLLLVVCGQLKRRKQTARDVARQCLVKIARALGVNQTFPRIFQHMQACLNEGGYQVHVLGYTLFQLMEAMQTETVAAAGASGATGGQNMLDALLPAVLKIVLEEIFEKAAATVESGYHAKIKLREVRQGKALDTLECLATCISFLPAAPSIHVLVEPFLWRSRERAGGADSASELNKCKEAFVRIRAGLLKNPTVTHENLLLYCHHAITAQRPQAMDAQEEEEEKTEAHLAPPTKGAAYADRLRYVPGQQLTGATAAKRAKLQSNSNSTAEQQHREYVFVEFALEWMHQACFASSKASSTVQESMLLPILELVISDVILSPLSSQKSLVLGLRMADDYLERFQGNGKCALSRALQYQLLNKALFFLRKNSQSAVLVSADVSKASVDLISTLLSLDLVKLKRDDVRVVIRICQLDLDNPTRFSSALRLLRCLFNTASHAQPATAATVTGEQQSVAMVAEIYDIALRLNEMVFQHSIKRKEQARCVELVAHFLLNFPLEKQRLEEHVQLIVKNISSYEHESGRLGGLHLLGTIISRFPAALIDYFSDFFLLTLCLVLQNDDSNAVKESTAKVLKTLFAKLSKQKLTASVLRYMERWFANPKSLALACQLAALLPQDKQGGGSGFTEQLLQVAREERTDDNALYQALLALERTNVSIELLPPQEIKTLLLFGDMWVRQVTSRMVAARLESQGLLAGIEGFDYVLILVDQLDSDQLSDELANTLLQSLLIILRHVKPSWFAGKEEIPLAWLLNKLCYIASRPEPLDLALKNRRRRVSFSFFEAVFTDAQRADMDVELVRSVVKSLNVIHVSHMDRFDPLAELKDRVLERMRQSVGVEALALALNQDQRVKAERRREKRTKRDVERVAPNVSGGARKRSKNSV